MKPSHAASILKISLSPSRAEAFRPQSGVSEKEDTTHLSHVHEELGIIFYRQPDQVRSSNLIQHPAKKAPYCDLLSASTGHKET